MNRKDFITSWFNTPNMRPAFIMIKDVPRLSGQIIYPKGTKLIGMDVRNGFTAVAPALGNVSLPIGSVKFIGYVDINHDISTRILDQFEVLENV